MAYQQPLLDLGGSLDLALSGAELLSDVAPHCPSELLGAAPDLGAIMGNRGGC